MTRPLRIQFPDAIYHVTCRGNERREIFRDQGDLRDFLQLLERSLKIYDVRLAAYACMFNHFHLMVCTPKANLSEFMRHFNISYTSAFNKKYQRSGHLYQGRYKAFLIDKDNYLLEVSRYIHLNPLRMQSDDSQETRWQDLLINDSTSLPGYVRLRNRKDFVDYAVVLNYFSGDNQQSRDNYRKFIEEGFREDVSSPIEKGKGTGIIGEEQFVDTVKKLVDTDKKSIREQPALRELGKKLTPEELIDRYSSLVEMQKEELTTKGRHSTERSMLMELLYRLCNISQQEIGRMLGGIDYSAVSQARKRIRLKIKNEPELEGKFSLIRNELEQLSRLKI